MALYGKAKKLALKEEMLRFGLIEDIDTPYQQQVESIKNQFQQLRDEKKQQAIEAADQGNWDKSEVFEKQRDALKDSMQRKLDSAARSYEIKKEAQSRKMSSPTTMKLLNDARLAELKAKSEAEAARQRQELESMQRESGEREAGRFRARAFGGGRSVARPMLSTARMAPEQTMAPGQTLGTFMPK